MPEIPLLLPISFRIYQILHRQNGHAAGLVRLFIFSAISLKSKSPVASSLMGLAHSGFLRILGPSLHLPRFITTPPGRQGCRSRRAPSCPLPTAPSRLPPDRCRWRGASPARAGRLCAALGDDGERNQRKRRHRRHYVFHKCLSAVVFHYLRANWHLRESMRSGVIDRQN